MNLNKLIILSLLSIKSFGSKINVDTIFISKKTIFLDVTLLDHNFLDTEAPIVINKSGNDNIYKLSTNRPFNDSYPMIISSNDDTYMIIIKYKENIKKYLYKIEKNIISNTTVKNNENEKKDKKETIFDFLENKPLKQNLSIKNEENDLKTIVGGLYTSTKIKDKIFVGVQIENTGIKKYEIDYSEFILEKKNNNDYSVISQKPVKCILSKNLILEKGDKEVIIIAIDKIQINQNSRLKLTLFDDNDIDKEDVRASNIYINYEDLKNIIEI